MRQQAQELAEERILDILVPKPRDNWGEEENENQKSTRQLFRKKLREKQLDDKEIELYAHMV